MASHVEPVLAANVGLVTVFAMTFSHRLETVGPPGTRLGRLPSQWLELPQRCPSIADANRRAWHSLVSMTRPYPFRLPLKNPCKQLLHGSKRFSGSARRSSAFSAHSALSRFKPWSSETHRHESRSAAIRTPLRRTVAATDRAHITTCGLRLASSAPVSDSVVGVPAACAIPMPSDCTRCAQ